MKIAVKGGKVYVDAAQVVTPDVMASNGVSHVIDKVILRPPERGQAAAHRSQGPAARLAPLAFPGSP